MVPDVIDGDQKHLNPICLPHVTSIMCGPAKIITCQKSNPEEIGQNINQLRAVGGSQLMHVTRKTDLKIFAVVIPKEVVESWILKSRLIK